MSSTTDRHPPGPWAGHARRALQDAGLRRGGAREAVIDFLTAQDCATSAQEIHAVLRAAGPRVSLASVYRALETLHGLGLVQRLEVGQGEALYEAALPSGEHHHHVVCERCERILPFEDRALEQAIARLARRVDFQVDAHEVVLHGRCPSCREADAH